MAVTDVFARRATLARSVRLLGEFRYEQSDPARFYGALADDTATMVVDLWRATHAANPAGRTVLDVGGGPGYFANAFSSPGCPISASSLIPPRCTPPRASTARRRGCSCGPPAWRCRSPTTAWTSACRPMWPSMCPSPWRLGAEMLRVTRPGGLAILSYTVWLGPFGGHEMGLTHYLGGARAAARYTRKHGHPPKNNYGSSLFAVSASDGLDWAASTGALIAAFPRYHPRWAWWVTSVPLLREFLVSNLVLVLQPPENFED